MGQIFSEIYFVSEINTVFPGQVSDFFKKSKIMQLYFSKVIAAENKIFGNIGFCDINVKTLSIKSGDLSKLTMLQLDEALSSDLYIVFGASYIKGWLIDFLVGKRALNIHMGLSPYYRGSSCNFWALYDNNPGFVGATIHYLSKGLDSGEILFHCVPKLQDKDSNFDFTMRSVEIAQKSLTNFIKKEKIFSMKSIKQDKTKEIRYTRNEDFNDKVATKFMKRNINLKRETIVYPTLVKPSW